MEAKLDSDDGVKLVTEQGVTAYSYLNTYLHNSPPLGTPLGTSHGSDILINRNLPLSASAQNATQIYYISFLYYQDPNAIDPAVRWPAYEFTERRLLNFTLNTVELGTDFFREDQWKTIVSLSDTLKT